MVLEGARPNEPELWTIDLTGTATKTGDYALPPTNNSATGTFGKLDGAGNFYQEGRGMATFEDIIIRRTLNGTSDVVYTEATNPHVKLHISAIITGP